MIHEHIKPITTFGDSATTLIRNSTVAIHVPQEQFSDEEILEKSSKLIQDLDFTALNTIISSLPNIQEHSNYADFHHLVEKTHVEIIENLIAQHEKLGQKAMQLKLARILYEYLIFLDTRRVNIPSDVHKNLVARLIESKSQPQSSLFILQRCNKNDWPAVLNTIAYYTMMQRTPESIRSEDMMEVACQELHLDKICNNNLESDDITSMLELNQFTGNLENRPNFHEKCVYNHWIGIKIKFEHILRSTLGGYFPTEKLPFAIRKEVSRLYGHLVNLCIDFGKFEYGWEWFDKLTLKQDWNALLAVSRLCLNANNETEMVWFARLFAVYKNVMLMDPRAIIGSLSYPEFMSNFCSVATRTEGENAVNSIAKILDDMLSITSMKYFPFSTKLYGNLCKFLWDTRFSSNKNWKECFKKVFEIYLNFKVIKSRQSLIARPFCSQDYLILMKLSTIIGNKDYLCILKADLLKYSDFSQVLPAYNAFINGQEQLAQRQQEAQILPVIKQALLLVQM